MRSMTSVTSQGVRAVGRLLGYAATFSNMAADKFTSKHLKSGDALPPHTGKPRVYSMRFCPYAHRIILAMNAKGVDYEVLHINLGDKPEWLTTKSKVPAVEVNEGDTIYESLIAVEYIDEVFPQRPLLPKDPVKKAMDKILVESLAPIQTVFLKAVKLPETITEENVAAFDKALDFIHDQLKNRGTKFFFGSEPGFADYMMWPWFERIMAYEGHESVKIDPKKYSLLIEYIDNMMKDPAVSQYLIPKETFGKFHEAFLAGTKPNFDLLSQ